MLELTDLIEDLMDDLRVFVLLFVAQSSHNVSDSFFLSAKRIKQPVIHHKFELTFGQQKLLYLLILYLSVAHNSH